MSHALLRHTVRDANFEVCRRWGLVVVVTGFLLISVIKWIFLPFGKLVVVILIQTDVEVDEVLQMKWKMLY